MSRLLVTRYRAEVEKIIRYGGSRKETSIRNAFERLLRLCRPAPDEWTSPGMLRSCLKLSDRESPAKNSG